MLLSDEKGTAFKSLGLLGQDGNHGAACYVLDPNYRIVASAGSNGVDSQAGQVLAILQESFGSPACLALDHHPPILIMPRLVTRQFCQYLLDLWQQEEGRATTPNGESAALGDLIIRNDANGSIRQYLVHDKEALSYLGYAINRREWSDFEDK